MDEFVGFVMVNKPTTLTTAVSSRLLHKFADMLKRFSTITELWDIHVWDYISYVPNDSGIEKA